MKHFLAIVAALAATPAMAQNATGDWRASLPPPEYDYEYKGQLVITKWNDYSIIRHICKDTSPPAVACSYRVYDSLTGKPLSCLIMLGPLVWDDPSQAIGQKPRPVST
jgi:hypothetical protein